MSEEDYSPEEQDEYKDEQEHWDDGEFDESTDWIGDHYDRKGCCLTCADSETGCMCYNCRCSRCSWQSNYNNKCLKVNDLKEEREEKMASHIEVVFTTNEFGCTLIKIRTTGPVNRNNYASFKPFLQTHFLWSDKERCYQQYSENWRFVQWLRQELEDCGFDPVEKIEMDN